jgi:hypothetical protein
MTYYDKSLLEVWSWKDQVSETLKKLTLSEQLIKLTESAEQRRLEKARRGQSAVMEKSLAN